jgi:hypothetical protein
MCATLTCPELTLAGLHVMKGPGINLNQAATEPVLGVPGRLNYH